MVRYDRDQTGRPVIAVAVGLLAIAALIATTANFRSFSYVDEHGYEHTHRYPGRIALALSFCAVLVGLAGLVVGLVALCQFDTPMTASAWGVGLSILSVALGVFVLASFGSY